MMRARHVFRIMVVLAGILVPLLIGLEPAVLLLVTAFFSLPIVFFVYIGSSINHIYFLAEFITLYSIGMVIYLCIKLYMLL